MTEAMRAASGREIETGTEKERREDRDLDPGLQSRTGTDVQHPMIVLIKGPMIDEITEENEREVEKEGYGGESDRGRDRNDRKAGERRDKGEDFVGIDGQRAAIVAEFVDGIASEQKNDSSPSLPPPMVDNDEEIMKKLGIPTGFNTTKVNT